MKVSGIDILDKIRQERIKKMFSQRPRISVGVGTCGIGNGAAEVYAALKKYISVKKLNIDIDITGCFGFCAQEPLVNIYIPGKPLVILHKVTKADAAKIIDSVSKGVVPFKKALCRIEEWDHHTAKLDFGKGFDNIPLWNEIPFFKWQKKIVLRNCGLINPEKIEDYIAVGGYQALYKTVKEMSPEESLEEMKHSRLHGRGGAGFPTWKKWELIKQEKSDKKYMICNADEGDPGAYMNRNELEGDPHMIIEGMAIGAYIVGADEGIVYIRAEYPLAVQRLKKAIEDAKKYGLLGKNIFGSNFNFDVSIVEGAGAFVCGEETALIASIEGKAGRPVSRPPFPAQKGLWGRPTNINNVETWCNVPVIMHCGGKWFSAIGTEKSAGTKVFSLVGKIKNTGLVEMPLGTSLQTIVYNTGEGAPNGKKIKAVQTGGPSGGYIPPHLFSTPVDYESLAKVGAIMGSGGMVIVDEDNCMVDMAKYFTSFATSESCGKCVPCRDGLYHTSNILKKITEGTGKISDLETLEDMGSVIKDTALCGLGQTAPNPVLTTLKYFRNEYEDHIIEKRCVAGVCQNFFISPCENSCPLHMLNPGWLQLFKEGRTEDAFALIMQDNPLPASTGRVCHHPCESRCRRNDIDGPISQREVHRFVAEEIYGRNKDKAFLTKLLSEKADPTGKKISIVGAGPAGLTAAYYLVRLGHSVTIYDSHKKAGGMLQYAIPEYRLPKAILDREIGFIKKLGVKFVFNCTIGKTKKLKALEKESDMMFIANGAQKEMKLGIPGEEIPGVFSGIDFLEKALVGGRQAIGKKVLVVGGGNVAIDAARTAARAGAFVTIVYRRQESDMPANIEEIEEAKAEGIKFVFMAAPEAIICESKKIKFMTIMHMEPGDFDSSGRKRPVATGFTSDLVCDSVITAIGERVDSAFVLDSGVSLMKNNNIKVDRFTMITSNQKIYAGGDAVSGPYTVTDAMAAGKKAAKAINLQLTGKDGFCGLFGKFDYSDEVCVEPQGGKRGSIQKLHVKKLNGDFREVSLGLHKKAAKNEAVRCLRCDIEKK